MATVGQQPANVLITGLTGTTSTGIEILSTSFPFPTSPIAQLGLPISVKDPLFNAKGDGVTDDAPAFTAALAASQSIYVPPGTYLLLTPVPLNQGNQIIGDGSRRSMNGTVGQNCAILLPVTAAFVTAQPTTQLVDVTIVGLCFQGGTTQIDFGLFHEVTCKDCEFRGFSTAGLCLVRGQNNNFANLRFDFTVNSTYGIGFGYEASINYSGGLYAGQNPTTLFGSADAFVDRTEMSRIIFQATTNTWKTAAWNSRVLSGTVASDFVFDGALGAQQDGILVNNLVRMQTCVFENFIIDGVNKTGTPLDGLFSPEALNCTFININPDFSGDCTFAKSFDIQQNFNCVYIQCSAAGDNVTTFGFDLGVNGGQVVSYINCTGSIFHSSVNALIQNSITQVGCDFTTSNLISKSNSFIDRRNTGMTFEVMADTGGALAATGPMKFIWAAGSGNNIIGFLINPTGPQLNNPVAFAGLPASPMLGMMAIVNNSSVNTFGSHADGAGALKVLVWYNGTNWTVIGQ